MPQKPRWTADELQDFFRTVGTVAAGAKVYADGVQYVDRSEFWHWFTADVVRQPIVDGVPHPLDSAEAIQSWVAARISEGKGRFVRFMLEQRGAEFDFVKSKQDNIIEFLGGNIWKRATQEQDLTQGVDAIRTNFLTGETETHQIKAGLSDAFKRVNLSPYMPAPTDRAAEYLQRNFKAHTPADVVDVNDSIYQWRTSEAGRAAVEARGDLHPDVRNSIHDQQIMERGQERLKQSLDGSAAPGVTLWGAAAEVASGAMVGAVIGIGISAASYYRQYRRGEISGAEFGNTLVKDSAQGAVMGGTLAAVNIPIQLAAHAIGVGQPITIPVMIVLGYGLRKIVQPIFGKGEFEKILCGVRYTTDLARGFAYFAEQSATCFYLQRELVVEAARLGARAKVLDAVSKGLDNILESELKEI